MIKVIPFLVFPLIDIAIVQRAVFQQYAGRSFTIYQQQKIDS
jgi:hypothetical protein